jgi:hypothetical protein
MMIFNYASKKQMKEHIGEPLDYTETSMFGNEYLADGSFIGCNRPYSPEYPKHAVRTGGAGKRGREFFATVTMKDGLIASVK